MKTETAFWDEIKAEAERELAPQKLWTDSDGPADCWLITAEVLGGGEEALGRKLMREFITELAAGETPPCFLLFVNSGVKLSAADSPLFPVIEAMAERGTAVLVSASSADFYGLEVDSLWRADIAAMIQALKSAAKVVTL